VRKEAARVGQQLGVGVGFIAGAERWLPPPDSVVTAKLVTQLMKQHTAADGAPLAPIVAFGLQVRATAPPVDLEMLLCTESHEGNPLEAAGAGSCR
jgi:hypothetical protein